MPAPADRLNAYTEALFSSPETVLTAARVRRLFCAYRKWSLPVPVDLIALALALGLDPSALE
jgi:hypothetical protein